MEGLKESVSLTCFFAFILHFYQYGFLQRTHLYSSHILYLKKKKKEWRECRPHKRYLPTQTQNTFNVKSLLLH